MLIVPYKSVAAALILAIFFGPIGVFYSSFLGGIVMSIFGLVSIGTMKSMDSYLPMVTVALFGIIWAMISVRIYNRKMLQIAINGQPGKLAKQVAIKPKKERLFFRKKNKLKNEGLAQSSSTNEVLETEENASSWKL